MHALHATPPEPLMGAAVGLAVGGAAGVILAAAGGFGAPMVVIGMVLGLAVGSSIDAARAKRRQTSGRP